MDQPGSGDVFQSNTSASALPSDVFDRNTPDVPDDVIRRVLSAGGNGQQSRERIAAFFMQDEFRPEDAAIFLRSEYGTGGKGIRVNGIDYAVWFDRDGLRIARGQDTRTPRAAVLSYEQAAQQIAGLLQSGQYATSEELANAKSNEYHELASSIWSIYHDRSEDAVQRGFFTQTAALADGIYPPAVEQLTHALENPAQRAVLAAELDAYAKAVQTDGTLYRFRFSKDAAVTSAARLQRTRHMTKLYAAADGFQPARAAFITQDEIDQLLCRGSGVSQGKQRIYSYFSEDHTQADRIRFLKDEYGIGGFGYIGYNENHDGRGISFERSENGRRYDKVALSWSQVEHQLRTIIRQNRYFTPEEQAKYERDRTDAATLSDPQPDVFQGNTPEETVQAAAADPAHDVFQGNTPEETVQAAAADPAHDVFQGNTPVNLPLDTADYQLLSRLQSDCDYFLNAGGRSEKHLWAGTVSAQIHKMRELYDALPVKPEWITSDAIDSYEQRMSPRYQVVVYHYTENGFDEKLEYQTQGEAERAAQAYVHGTMESDGFAYDGAAVYDLMEKRYLNAYGSFPDQRAQPQKDAVQDNVFQGNTPEEAVQADAADLPYGSVFDLDTLEESAQLINSYCNEEFGTDADLSDSSNIGLGYSTTEDEQHEIQITANLPARAIYYTVDQDVVHTIQCDSLSELNTYLANLSFSELIADAEHFYYEKHPQETPNHDVFQRNTSADNTIMVRCDWSESAAFVDGKIYSVAEFDRLMKDAEDAHAEGRAAAMKMYGSWDNALAADDAEAIHYFGYDKTKFTLLLPDGRTFTERQDIGDGHGGLLDFLSQYSTYADIMPTLEEAVQAAAADPAHDVFQGNTPEEAVQTAAADPAHDVFQGNTPEEAVQAAAADPAHDVFQGNTPEEAVQAAAADPAHDVFHPNTQNFRITDDALGTGTLAQKFDGNISAIRLLKSLEAENRPATAEEQTLLSQYVGWGGMANAFSPGNRRYEVLRSLLTEDEYKAARASVLNAHYTAPVVIRAIYDAVHHMGFDGGKILEPAMGTGNFFGLLPEHMADSQLTGVELDSITGRIARKLYPNADIKITGYENTRFADHSFDLAVGNVPFGDYSLHDRRYDKDHLLIHDYFFIKTLDKVRPGGLVALVTSKGTLDKTNPAARRLMAERADLLGAIRLPNTAFKANAGTNVTADILFLQKRDAPPQQLPPWTETGRTEDGMELNRYFLQHPEMILGTMQEVTTQYGKDTACVPDPNVELEDLLSAAVLHLGHENVFPSNTPAPALPENMDMFHSNTSAEALRPYSYTMQGGRLMFKDAQENLIPAEKNATATKRAVGLIAVRDAARQLIEAQRDGCNDARLHTLQGELNQRYDAFVKAFGNIHMRGNKLAFHDDASYPLLLALEKLDEEQNVTGKSDIFSKRTISPHIAVSHADTPEDALGLSLTERGQIDFTYMSSLLDGMPQEQITAALQQQIFRDPSTDSWQPADEYLSGNVRAKLDAARRAAENDPSFAVNVKMLEQVQPAPLTASDISVRLGTTWIPPEDINQFMAN
ncbi:LPD11 domain-containing protein [Agathobaculum desmolans]|uniref:LPD11 domain-containing protein n=1 Tax=Agathobaculum desmolans TaxID=39484 RepID=UPI0039945335